MVYYFSVQTRKKRLFFSLSLVSIILCILSLIFAFQQYNLQQNNQFAIIFTEEIAVQTEPNNRAEKSFLLHEGTKVAVLEDFSGFVKIELSDGTQGWVKEEALKKL